MQQLSHDLYSVRAFSVCFAILLSSLAAGADDSRGLAVIPPGYEVVLADMLGRGEHLPGACSFTGASIDRTLIRSAYSCGSGAVVYELRHVREAPPDATVTDKFSLIVAEGAPPQELAKALEARVRAGEAEFEWSWTPLPGPEETNDYFSSLGRAAALSLLVLIAASALGWLLLRSIRPSASRPESPVRDALAGTALALVTCLLVHGALRLTGSSFAAILRGETLTWIAIRAVGIVGLILSSAIAVALLGRHSLSTLLRLWIAAIVLAYAGVGYRASLLPHDLHFFGRLSTYPPNTTLSETLPDQLPVIYRINARGFRHPDFDQTKVEDTIRVAVVGDSFVFGIGVNYDDSLRPQLGSELARRWPNRSFEILNLGIPGNNLASHVEMVELVTERLDPDVVILALTLANDLSAWDEQDARRDARRYGIYSFARFLIGDSVESLWALMFLERETTAAGLDRFENQLQQLQRILERATHRPMLVFFGFQPWDPPIAALLEKVPNALVVPNRTTTAEEFIPGDGHPTGLGNQRSAAHIAKALSRSATWLDLVND